VRVGMVHITRDAAAGSDAESDTGRHLLSAADRRQIVTGLDATPDHPS